MTRAGQKISSAEGPPAARATVVPLRLRLPNPPAIFVGREHEVAWFLQVFDRAPVTLVDGPGGLGKTSLVQSALHQHPGGLLDRILAFSATAGEGGSEELVRQIASALATHGGRGALDHGALSDPQGLLSTTIDMADDLGAVVVIDDLHLAGGELVHDLLRAAQAYARSSQWVATTRAASLIPEFSEQTIWLSAIEPEALSGAARLWLPEASQDEVAESVQQASGSPFWLKHRLFLARHPVGSEVLTRLLSGCAERCQSLLEQLSAITTPVPYNVLATLGTSTEEDLAELERRALVERVPGGLRLHAVARTLFEPPRTSVQRALARTLVGTTSPTLWLAAIDLLRDLGEEEEVVDLVRLRYRSLVATGLASRLWQLVSGLHDERLLEAKFALALDLGAGASVEWASAQPAPQAVAARLTWIELMTQCGRLAEANHEAKALAQTCEGTAPRTAALAWLMVARTRIPAMDHKGILRACDAAKRLGMDDPEIATLADAFASRAWVFAESPRRALALALSLEGRSDSLSPEARREVETQRGAVFSNLGRTRRAYEAFVESQRQTLVSTDQLSRRLRLARGSLFAIDLGRLDEGRSMLDQLAPLVASSPEMQVFFAMNAFRYHTAMGQAPAAEEDHATMLRAVAACSSEYWRSWTETPGRYLALLKGEPWVSAAVDTPGRFPFVRAMAAWHAIRFSGNGRPLAKEAETDISDASTVLSMARAAEALLCDETERAVREARAALATAQGEGLVLWAADALVCLCETLLLQPAPLLDHAAEQLRQAAAGLRGSRYQQEALFFGELTKATGADRLLFEQLAASTCLTPAVRRSRALCGRPAPLDQLDRKIVGQARQRLGWAAAPEEETAARHLRFDGERRRLNSSFGLSLDLSRKPVAAKIVGVLVSQGGSATKEDLAQAVWGISDYHPLRDDKRLQVAVSRLRALLGDDGLVQTTDDGYRLAPDLLLATM